MNSSLKVWEVLPICPSTKAARHSKASADRSLFIEPSRSQTGRSFEMLYMPGNLMREYSENSKNSKIRKQTFSRVNHRK